MAGQKVVLIRDDDTNALTPVDWLEKLYRPFLDAGLPVNLATIPNVKTHVTYGEGVLEGFLVARNGEGEAFRPLASAPGLVEYLKANDGYEVVQHGCHHEFVEGAPEFDHGNRADIVRRLEEGKRCLLEAGFEAPETFVAPYDRLTPVSYEEVAARFRIISTGWFEWRRLPRRWLGRYAMKKLARRRHWKVGGTRLLSHPGCYLSYHREPSSIVPAIAELIDENELVVLVTHWWEFFRDGRPDEGLIDVLHETAALLRARPDVRVVRFRELGQG